MGEPAGIAAEIGSMVVTEQVDALRMCAADPVDYLIKPRFIASLIMTTVLVVIAAAVAFSTGMYTGYVFFGINPRTFVNIGHPMSSSRRSPGPHCRGSAANASVTRTEPVIQRPVNACGAPTACPTMLATTGVAGVCPRRDTAHR